MAGRIYEHFDVVIAGAGSAGVAAALAADRAGARVCLLEKEPALGGSFVQGGMTAFRDGGVGEILPGLRALCVRRGGYLCLEPEAWQSLCYRLLADTEVLLLTGAWVMEAALDNGMITHLTVLTREGTLQVEGDTYIDATGDGDLAALASVPFTQGREEDGQPLPAVYSFTLEGCKAGWESVQLPREALAELGLAEVHFRPAYGEEEVSVLLLDGEEAIASSAIDRARADVKLRGAVEPVLALLREQAPFAGTRVIRRASRVVFPEGRHPQGHTVLDTHDLTRGTVFPDGAVGPVTAPIELTGREDTEEAPRVESYTIPYRAMLPVRVKNLLLAGRCISGTHRAYGSFRALPVTLATGDAAGKAAARAAREMGGKVKNAFTKDEE